PDGGKKPPLYFAPESRDAENLVVVESELDAILLAQSGIAAAALGGSAIKDGAVEILHAKKRVVLIPDNDPAGGGWSEKLAFGVTDWADGPEGLNARVP